METLVTLLLLCTWYGLFGLVVWGLTLLFRHMGMRSGIRIFIASLVLGFLAGILSMWLWPQDISAVVNLPASLLGEWLYTASIRLIGDPHSAQAHFTTFWLLRVPQVFVLASLLFWGGVGLIIQAVINLLRHRQNEKAIDTQHAG